MAETRPNIIVLVADDMRHDALGVAGNSRIRTPNLDALAREGTRFTQAFVTTSICMASRASLLTGLYSRRHAVDDFATPLSREHWADSYPMRLRAAGFFTGFVGKFGVGNRMPVSDFDFWRGFPGQGFYEHKTPDGQPIHLEALMASQMVEFLDSRDKTRPFCLSVSFKAPHSEDANPKNNGFLYDPAFESLYANTEIPYPKNGGDERYKQFPEAFRFGPNGQENEARVRYKLRFSDSERFQTSARGIYRLVSGLDDAVGTLRAALKDRALEKNTVILFVSDNGYCMGEFGLEGKWYGHEPSIRVPIIVHDGRAPKARPRVTDRMALNIDIAPTVFDFADVPIPKAVQGVSLRPLTEATPRAWRTDFFYEHRYDTGPKVYIPHTEGVVESRYKYMRYCRSKTDTRTIHEELFDRIADPSEDNNLAQNPSLDREKQRLAARLETLRAAAR